MTVQPRFPSGTMAVCPRCLGQRQGLSFSTGPGLGVSLRPCSVGITQCRTCLGSGQVTEECSNRIAVGELIRKARVEARKTQREVARALGVDVVLYSHLEQGKHPSLLRFDHFRETGWPLCPECGADDLYSKLDDKWFAPEIRPRSLERTFVAALLAETTLEQCLLSKFYCDTCKHVID